MPNTPERSNKRRALKIFILRALWALVLGICGFVLIAREANMVVALGVFLMLWGNNHGLLVKQDVIRAVGRK